MIFNLKQSRIQRMAVRSEVRIVAVWNAQHFGWHMFCISDINEPKGTLASFSDMHQENRCRIKPYSLCSIISDVAMVFTVVMLLLKHHITGPTYVFFLLMMIICTLVSYEYLNIVFTQTWLCVISNSILEHPMKPSFLMLVQGFWFFFHELRLL